MNGIVKWLVQHLGGLVNEGGEALGGGVEVECRSGAGVEFVLDAFEVGLGVAAEIGAPFEPEPQEPVGVFVGAALPRGVRVAEEHRGIQLQLDVFPVGHLTAAVPGIAAATASAV